MLARVFTLRFDAVQGGFDDSPLREFLVDKDVLAIREHFFTRHEVPYMAVMVTYYPARPEATTPVTTSRRQSDTSWRALLTEADLPLFNALRDWRSERSKHDGVPPYVICTKKQFALMIKARPHTLSALTDIEGFGAAKRDKYGRELLGILTASTGNGHTVDASTGQGEPNDADNQS